MRNVLTYIYFRQKSFFYYRLPKLKIKNDLFIYVALSVILLFSAVFTTLITQLYTNHLFSHNEIFYISTFFIITFLLTGIQQSITNTVYKTSTKNDLKLLILSPLSFHELLLAKYFETTFLKEILISSILIPTLYLYHYSQIDSVFLGIVFTLNSVCFLYIMKFSVFYLSVIGYRYIATAYQLFFSILRIFVLAILAVIFLSNKINFQSHSMLNSFFNLISLDSPKVFQCKFIVFLQISLLIIVMLLIRTSFSHGVKAYFIGENSKNRTVKTMISHLSFHERKELSLIQLMIAYIKRQRKQEIIMTYLPLFSSLFSIILILYLLYYRIPAFMNANEGLVFIILSAVIVKMLSDTYCFLASIDFHGARFQLLKLTGIHPKFIVRSHIILSSSINITLFIILFTIATIVFQMSFSFFIFICVMAITQMILFNCIYFLSSISYPEFNRNFVSNLPSSKAKMTANLLILFCFLLEGLMLIIFDKQQYLAFIISTLIYLIFIFIILKISSLKIQFLNLSK
ncbi:hypothetical protein CEY02_03815 [Bacillus pumilus]|uniref:Uncharacterized protein n=1 Tax=Bacillus pumilus TaxID=1408 RepID=A0A2A5IZI7_BACPU|nr:hypothetical protein CEY02_03815 [Bacillus pumilus]